MLDNKPTLNQAEFAARRQKFLQQLPANSIAILSSADECYRNGDTHYNYRQNSNFYYLTGFTEPDAVAVFIPRRTEGEFILFNRVKDPSKEIWTGYYAGQAGAVKDYGANQAFAITELDAKMVELLTGKQRVYYATARNDQFDVRVMHWVNELQAKVRSGVGTPTEFFNIETIVHEMRLIKSSAELAIMRHAGNISAQAHKKAMHVCHPGMYEYQLQAAIEYEFKYHGSSYPAYGSIVGGGKNACILHYVDNNAVLNDGDLVLVDAGGEYEYYSSDITRTYPINGKFSAAQRALYELVLRVQLSTIALVKPGVRYDVLQDHVRKELTRGLIELGLLTGDLEKLIADKAYFDFYMHNFGHWLGLDTHDAGTYKVDGQWRELKAGMVLTVEPGLYVAPDNHKVDAKWRGIGIRIEDDVLVTETGYEVLTVAVPKSVEEIERLCAGK